MEEDPAPSRPPDPASRQEGTDGRDGRGAGAYLGLGLQFALSIVVFVYLGQWADRRFGTEPWLLLAGLLFGAGGSFYSIFRKLMADLERDEARRRR